MSRAIPLFTIGCLFSSLALLAGSAFAQSAPELQGAAAPAPAYNTANEIIVNGTISQVLTHPAVGLPLGLHLMVSTPQGTVDAHLGRYLAPLAGQKGLISGAPVRMTGVKMHLPAGDVFVVRTISVGGQTIVVRSTSGIPLRQFHSSTPLREAPGAAAAQKEGL